MNELRINIGTFFHPKSQISSSLIEFNYYEEGVCLTDPISNRKFYGDVQVENVHRLCLYSLPIAIRCSIPFIDPEKKVFIKVFVNESNFRKVIEAILVNAHRVNQGTLIVEPDGSNIRNKYGNKLKNTDLMVESINLLAQLHRDYDVVFQVDEDDIKTRSQELVNRVINYTSGGKWVPSITGEAHNELSKTAKST